MPVVRISKGSVARDQLAEAERLLAESEAALREPLQNLNGLLHYYVGIDRELGYLTNVSVWETLETPTKWTACSRCLRSARFSKQPASASRLSPTTKRSGRSPHERARLWLCGVAVPITPPIRRDVIREWSSDDGEAGHPQKHGRQRANRHDCVRREQQSSRDTRSRLKPWSAKNERSSATALIETRQGERLPADSGTANRPRCSSVVRPSRSGSDEDLRLWHSGFRPSQQCC